MLVIVGIQFDSRAFMMAGFARNANPANDSGSPAAAAHFGFELSRLAPGRCRVQPRASQRRGTSRPCDEEAGRDDRARDHEGIANSVGNSMAPSHVRRAE